LTTFLLSWLSRQYAPLDATVFLREQPGEWLVLEPLPDAPARGAEPLATRVALHRGRSTFTLGRDPASDLVLGGAGVELAHAVLEEAPGGGWTIRRAAAGARVTLDGLELGDPPAALGSGARIGLGGVAITYYDGNGFHARLRVGA
jgi:hypothetical protein